MLTAVNPPGASFPGISQATIVKGSGVVFSTGMCPIDAEGNIVEGSFEKQVEAVYENIAKTLKAAGIGFESVARLVTYVAPYDPSMVPIIRKVRSRYLSKDTPPASVLIGAAALYDPRVHIEVEFVAVIP